MSATATPAAFVVLNFKPLKKNTLQGVFDLQLPSGLVLCGCQLHEKGEARWVGTPATRYVKSDGQLSDYVKVVDFSDAKAKARFQDLAMAALDVILDSPTQ